MICLLLKWLSKVCVVRSAWSGCSAHLLWFYQANICQIDQITANKRSSALGLRFPKPGCCLTVAHSDHNCWALLFAKNYLTKRLGGSCTGGKAGSHRFLFIRVGVSGWSLSEICSLLGFNGISKEIRQEKGALGSSHKLPGGVLKVFLINFEHSKNSKP